MHTGGIPILVDTGHFFLEVGHLRICRQTSHPSDQLTGVDRGKVNVLVCVCVGGGGLPWGKW